MTRFGSAASRSACVRILVLALSFSSTAFGFSPSGRRNTCQMERSTAMYGRTSLTLQLSPSLDILSTATMDYSVLDLAFWVGAFSVSHIGMSAVRRTLIGVCGQGAQALNLVGQTGDFLTLPKWWPGDDVGQQKVFPNEEIAGRQIYRAFYTAVSFATLGNALLAYLHATSSSTMNAAIIATTPLGPEQSFDTLWMAVAAASMGISIASLFNPSPLSLVPGFEQTGNTKQQSLFSSITATSSSSSILGLQRRDALKLEPRGLTRITRHPLILPVVPWGIATSVLAGGRPADFFLFAGLSLYAVVGCAAQDLRVLKEEGSVGTVFDKFVSTSNNSAAEKDSSSLENFFQSTSFLPFGASVDGRQSLSIILQEFPLLPFLVGCIAGYGLEAQLLSWLDSF